MVYYNKARRGLSRKKQYLLDKIYKIEALASVGEIGNFERNGRELLLPPGKCGDLVSYSSVT